MSMDGGGDLFIVGNSDREKALDYLRGWAQIPHNSLDIATGYFEIGSLLKLDGYWQGLDKIRILMGEEVTRRTRDALVAGLAAVTERLEASIEQEKQVNDFLMGVAAIVAALRDRPTAVREVAHGLGFRRTGDRIATVIDSALILAVKRGVVKNERGWLALDCRNIGDYPRELLIDALLGAMERRWIEREEATRAAARYLGFRRTGAAIQKAFKSVIRGALLRKLLKSEGTQIRKTR